MLTELRDRMGLIISDEELPKEEVISSDFRLNTKTIRQLVKLSKPIEVLCGDTKGNAYSFRQFIQDVTTYTTKYKVVRSMKLFGRHVSIVRLTDYIWLDFLDECDDTSDDGIGNS